MLRGFVIQRKIRHDASLSEIRIGHRILCEGKQVITISSAVYHLPGAFGRLHQTFRCFVSRCVLHSSGGLAVYQQKPTSHMSVSDGDM